MASTIALPQSATTPPTNTPIDVQLSKSQNR